MQIHKGVQHGQVQLFPGRTRTGIQKRRLGSGSGHSTWEAPTLRPVLAWPRGRVICCKSPGVAGPLDREMQPTCAPPTVTSQLIPRLLRCPEVAPTHKRFLGISSHIPRQSPHTSHVQKVPYTLDPHTIPKHPDTQSPVHLRGSEAHGWSQVFPTSQHALLHLRVQAVPTFLTPTDGACALMSRLTYPYTPESAEVLLPPRFPQISAGNPHTCRLSTRSPRTSVSAQLSHS